ncbi:LmeA family phospholipid-binding protein [Flexivirga lutea]
MTALRNRLRRTAPLLVDLLIAVVVFGLAAWGLDWASRIGAQGAVARSVQHSQQLTQRPHVGIRGWFFVPQVVTGRYDDVHITLHDLRHGSLRLSTVTARLQGVHVPLHAVVTGGVTTIVVEHSHETVVIDYTDLNRYLRSLGSNFTVLAGSSAGRLKITGHADIAGRQFAVSADATVQPTPGALQILPVQLDTGTTLDAATRVLLDRRLTLTIPTAPFPFGQQITAITPSSHGLTVRAAGSDVVVKLPRKSRQ